MGKTFGGYSGVWFCQEVHPNREFNKTNKPFELTLINLRGFLIFRCDNLWRFIVILDSYYTERSQVSMTRRIPKRQS